MRLSLAAVCEVVSWKEGLVTGEMMQMPRGK